MSVLRRLFLSLRAATVAAVLTGALFALVDFAVRTRTLSIDLVRQSAATIGVYLAITVPLGVLGGLAIGLVVEADRLARRRAGVGFVAPTLIGLLAALSLAPSLFGGLSGHGLSRTAAGRSLPYLAIAAVAVVYAVGAIVVERVDIALKGGRTGPHQTFVIGCAVAIVTLIGLDLNAYVALYASLHFVIEVVAATLCLASIALTLRLVDAPRRRSLSVACVLAIVYCAGFVASPRLRSWHEDTLRDARRDPLYIGRQLRRINTVETLLHLKAASHLEQLADNYDLSTLARDPRWDKPPPEPAGAKAALTALRRGTRYNILVYYVDTLRRDVAYDPEIMPEVARFAERGLKFDRAYSTGSDTRRALPALVTGSYDPQSQHENGLLYEAKSRNIPTTLFIGESAFEFLNKLVPDFAFEETIRHPDYAQGGVWGYGAHQPTAGRLVDHAIEWLSQRDRSTPFIAWIFNFDVHGWRELDHDYVYGVADRYHVPEQGPYNWRYRVVARSVDAEFGRLIKALDDQGLADDTLVLFVSDHGEGLGYRGFWVHSTFLWESLVRVPLILRAPGISPKVVSRPVSLVDVAPTLGRYIDPDLAMNHLHGDDLLRFTLPTPPARRLPLLLTAASDDTITKIGIVDDRYKLIVPTDWGSPELYDVRTAEPDESDVMADHPGEAMKMLSDLFRSPIVPR